RVADAGRVALYADARRARSASRWRRGCEGFGVGSYGPHRNGQRDGSFRRRLPRNIRPRADQVESMKNRSTAAGALAPAVLMFCVAAQAQVKAPAGLPPLSWPANNPYTQAKAELGRYLYFEKRLSA